MSRDRTQREGMVMKIWGRYPKHWLLAVFVAAAAAAAAVVASAQSMPSTEYRYDNNGNLHQVLLTCNTGSLLCGSQCVPSINNCGTCGDACRVILDINSFATTYSGTLQWTTNAPTTTRIRYRAVSMSGTSLVTADPWTEIAFGASLSTAHVATMSDLYPVARYEWQAIGTDGGGSTFYSATSSFETPKGAYDVGVISYRNVPNKAATCPAQKNLVTAYLDNEDWPNVNNRSGWIGGIGSDSMGTLLPFCRINGKKLQPLTTYLNPAYEYAVLSLSATCPDGSVSFWRHFDTEDDNNASELSSDRSLLSDYEGDTLRLSPNYRDASRNVRLFFCMFRYSATPMARFPDLSQPYGVFAPGDFALAVQRGWVLSDDENVNNGNAYGSPYPSESQRIVSSGIETLLFTAQVGCGPGSASSAGQTCGSCGGNVQCDGSCSIATPGNFGQACGCGGTVMCSGSCSKPACPTGQQCNGGICVIPPPPPPPSGCLPAGSDCSDGTCCKGCNIKLQICRA